MTHKSVFFCILILLLNISTIHINQANDLIVDSDMTFEESIKGTKAPKDVLDELELLIVKYYSFDNKIHQGQILIHKSVSKDVKEVFELILKTKFKVNKVIPIVKYNWSDDASMADNNSSAFCYRFIAGTKRMSNHAFGKAIDINPMQNPVIYSNGKISPKGAKYNPISEGTFSSRSEIVQFLLEKGWRWGGNFNNFKDYHHFDKK